MARSDQVGAPTQFARAEEIAPRRREEETRFAARDAAPRLASGACAELCGRRGDANNSRGAGGGARGGGARCCRRTPWASCFTSYRSPTTSLKWRRHAMRCAMLRSSRLRPFSGKVADARRARRRFVWRCCGYPTVASSPAPLIRRQDLARRRVRTIKRAHQLDLVGESAAGRALSHRLRRPPRGCNPTARSSAPSRSGKSYCASQCCLTACTLRSALLTGL